MSVKVYWNLRKKCFSVKSGKLPVQHKICFLLINCKFHISKSGQIRCRTERVRNVHAYIIAEQLKETTEDWNEIKNKYAYATNIRYNPYRSEYFTTEQGKQIFTAKYLLCRVTGKNSYQILAYE